MQSVEHWLGFPCLVMLKEHNTASSCLGMKTLAFLKVFGVVYDCYINPLPCERESGSILYGLTSFIENRAGT